MRSFRRSREPENVSETSRSFGPGENEFPLESTGIEYLDSLAICRYDGCERVIHHGEVAIVSKKGIYCSDICFCLAGVGDGEDRGHSREIRYTWK